ncbi:hypothetical protein [Rhodoferax sp. GW822-FHT02A01]|uniref:hypothetical protein n=1 Tax=Rhodoferax sp. GW822-FHT02A01 TaxID=3141537 RepID=UPI00315CDF49
MIVLGIDPGQNTGVATFSCGRLESLQTIAPHQIPAFIRKSGAGRVVFEDSRLTSFVFTTVKSRPAALKMARNVGQVDAWCQLIVLTCGDLGIPAHGISPAGKGTKLDAKAFARMTGWLAASNEHTRDAATVAWPYRRAA